MGHITLFMDLYPKNGLVRYRLRFSQAHWCYNDTTTESISFMLRKTAVITLKNKTKQNKTKKKRKVIPHPILS